MNWHLLLHSLDGTDQLPSGRHSIDPPEPEVDSKPGTHW